MSSSVPVHSKIITQVGRKVLRPFGFFQKGRSRIWISDQSWWIGIVDFQPSDGRRGTYLGYHIEWLWGRHDYITFDFGHRGNEYYQFENEEQFETIAATLALKAAMKVDEYRKSFRSVESASDYFLANLPLGHFPKRNAAILHGLARRMRDAADLFVECAAPSNDSREWASRARQDAAYLLSLVAEPDLFREEIIARIHHTRTLQRLPALEKISFATAPSTLAEPVARLE